MKKSELIEVVANKTGLSRHAARIVLDAALSSILTELRKGRNVEFGSFGTFEVGKRRTRKGRNPRTGEAIEIRAGKVPTFRPGRSLREAVRGLRPAL